MASSKRLVWLAFVASCFFVASVFAETRQAEHPPMITRHPPFEKAYKIGDRLELPCLASGLPDPTYTWQKNGEPLVFTGEDIKQLPNDGTLVIADPSSIHEGVYQCFASNKFGTAVSVKSVLKKAVLEPFPTVKEPTTHRPLIGSPLVLHCHPPHSYPTASIYWGENRNSSKLKPIENTARVSQDYSGNLYFANVHQEDALYRGNGRYLCAASNGVLRSWVQGDDQLIEPRSPSGATPKYEPPRSMWTSPGLDIAVKGQTKRMKCIFSGYPTPRVNWIRLDSTMAAKNTNGSYGQELVIPDVDFSDAGRYQCLASNQAGSEPQVKDFTLTVESPPFWRTKPPEDVNTSEDESAIFECLVNGHPKPTVTWFINGVPLEDSPANDRRHVSGGNLRYETVTKTDAQVVQCNASNAHGYIFANAYLNVLAEAPTFIDAPQKELKVAEGQTAILKCRVFGAPKPGLIWQKGSGLEDVTDLDFHHFKVLDSGNLEITNVRKEDQDTYQCYVHNKFGSDVASGRLLVVERTLITESPTDQVLMAGTDVTLKCNATTDPNELTSLKIEWKRDGEILSPDDDDRWSLVDGGRRLTIKRILVEDSGSYTCTASNGLDSDSVTVELTVKDRPKPPYAVRVTACTEDYADISWLPGSDSNDQVTSYTVYYNTTHDEQGKFTEAAKVNSTWNQARISLRPWTTYSFHVTAENAVGVSDRSKFSEVGCSTKQARPYRNPNRVCTETRDPHSLVIVWEPMLRTEHNGEGFHYVISYKRHDIPGAEEVLHREYDWRQSEHRVSRQETYKPFEISVQAVNSMGPAPETAKKKLGYSGEDVPRVIPENFELVADSVNATTAMFRWLSVDSSPEAVKGFFRGYQIRFWKVDDDSNVRTEDVIFNEWHPCVPLRESMGRRRRSLTEAVEAVTSKLWPFSNITAGVLVLNGAKSGQLSQTVTFETPEGVPGAVPAFWVSERGSHHLRLSWTAPFEVNGILIGYKLRYKKAPPAIGMWHETYIYDSMQTYKKIHDLDSDTAYLLSIVATTRVGEGQEMTIQESTVDVHVPDVPAIEHLTSGYDSVNVSWFPSGNGKQTPRNPGREFIVAYRLESESDFKETLPEKDHNWLNVTDLEHGKTYEFAVVALNRGGDRMKSEHRFVIVGVFADAVVHHAASAPWLIALICFVLLILLIVIIVILARRNRGGKYPVYEKEKLHGNKGRLDEEPTFAEYVRTEESMIKKSQGSLESSSKSEEDGSDSLGAYEDVDPTKFNDEGSFVDQAGYKKPLISSEARPNADLTSSSAMTAYV